ncbi:MAG: hypothetical protein AB7F43_03910 [Bacteriovoracia bacterium]
MKSYQKNDMVVLKSGRLVKIVAPTNVDGWYLGFDEVRQSSCEFSDDNILRPAIRGVDFQNLRDCF